MAMYYGYQHGLQLAGIFGMSCLLNMNSKVYQVNGIFIVKFILFFFYLLFFLRDLGV